MFSNREIAIIIWINLFLLYCLIKTDIRKPLKNLIKAAFNKKLILLYIIIYSYIAILIYILYKIKYWNIYFIKDTLIWLITVPIFSIMKAEEESKKYFKETLKSCFEIYILIEFIGVNYPFSIWIELIIIPIVDLFNGEVISYNLSRRPVFAQVVDMLEKAFSKIPDNTNLILHSDQGWQYQMKQYQHLLKKKELDKVCLEKEIV